MNKFRIKLMWGMPKSLRGDWRLGLFNFYDRDTAMPETGLAISVRGAVCWAFVFAIGVYVGAAGFLYSRWKENPYNLLTFSDALFYPLRRREVSDKQGQAYLAEGAALYRAKKYFDAATLLRTGLARHPNDTSARLMLAEFYVLVQQRPLALKVLQEGLTDKFPGRTLVEALLKHLVVDEDYRLTAQLCDRYLASSDPSLSAVDRRWLKERKFAALHGAGMFAEALALAESEAPSDAANEHRIVALLELRRTDDALAALDRWQQVPKADLTIVTRLRVRALREAGRLPEMEQALDELRRLAPAEPGPLAFGVVQRAMASLDAAANRALDDYFFRYGGTVGNLLLVAEPLGEINGRALLQRCLAAAVERGYPLERFDVLLIQTQVTQGDFAAAERMLSSLPPQPNGREQRAAQAWREWMTALISAATSPASAPQLTLVELLRSRPWSVRVFSLSIQAMLQAGRLETARDLADVASRTFPANPKIIEGGKEAARRLATRVATTSEAPEPVRKGVLPEKQFFQQLGNLISLRQWNEAEKLLREARQAAPPWLANRDSVIRLAQITIAQGQGDFPAMITAAGLYLNGDLDRAQTAIMLAREFDQAGDRTNALALAKLVARKAPNYQPARQAVKEWQVETDRPPEDLPASPRP